VLLLVSAEIHYQLLPVQWILSQPTQFLRYSWVSS